MEYSYDDYYDKGLIEKRHIKDAFREYRIIIDDIGARINDLGLVPFYYELFLQPQSAGTNIFASRIEDSIIVFRSQQQYPSDAILPFLATVSTEEEADRVMREEAYNETRRFGLNDTEFIDLTSKTLAHK